MSDGTYRVLCSPRSAEEFLLLDTTTADPVYVSKQGYSEEQASTIDAIEPGNTVDATIDWSNDQPRFGSVTIETETTISFASDATNIFEAARACWRETVTAGDPMNSRLTRGTDGDVNGVLYTFAEQTGERELFSEFRDGIKPLDPLLEPITASEPPYAIFCLDPRELPCVVVQIVLEPDGLLAETMRDTYTFDSC
ncbi:DUF6663 family protein [Halocatena pleomorpha]|uniref:Uncharacterized protein n=1 Tax=Halocatena pleomorpha TaxID=1785090 RepID=A0A3P3R656_9EURY|nr:DUF6663 family protein [Halocatena pleomorpha]RRJ28936.1 hypothetical protein EIK79_14575 [Halocatena pleomorpha]